MQYSIHAFRTAGLYTRDNPKQLWFPLNVIHQPQLNQDKPNMYSTAHADLNASVEYEHFYSRVSMCKTRALERSYSTRALQYTPVLVYSTRLELASLTFEFARSNIVHEGTITYMYSTAHTELKRERRVRVFLLASFNV